MRAKRAIRAGRMEHAKRAIERAAEWCLERAKRAVERVSERAASGAWITTSVSERAAERAEKPCIELAKRAAERAANRAAKRRMRNTERADESLHSRVAPKQACKAGRIAHAERAIEGATSDASLVSREPLSELPREPPSDAWSTPSASPCVPPSEL